MLFFASFLFIFQFHFLFCNINDINFTYVKTVCENIREFPLCQKTANKYLNKLNLHKLDDFKSLSQNLIKNVSDLYYYIGQIDFYGHINESPNLDFGLTNIIISSYFGNAKALYILYILFENEIINQIIGTKTYLSYIKQNPLLLEITKTKFYVNFNKTLEKNYSIEQREAIALSFLYSSSLGKYPPALNTLGNKFNEGYGLKQSCEAAVKYYMQSAHQTIKDLTKNNVRNLYQYPLLIDYEYIDKKFEKRKDEKILDKIEYFKLSALKGDKSSAKKLADLYLFGIGVKRDNKESFKWFKHGADLNDTSCIFYLGEMYLNGWGTEVNYEEALKLFKIAAKYNYSKAFNSLGYMYYYGYGVEKNSKIAFDYFQNSINKNRLSDAYYNAISLLIDQNSGIKTDFTKAYNYANIIAGQGHTFGSYMFAMLNQFKLGNTLKLCDVNIEYFKDVAMRNYYEKDKYDLAYEYYNLKKYKSSTLLFIELAEEGFPNAQVNAAIMLKNYNIFKDKDLQNYLTYKYTKMTVKNENIFGTLSLANFYYKGFGDLKVNYKKAMTYYKKVITQPTLNLFYSAHARFQVGMMYSFGLGVERNLTLANLYFTQVRISKTAAKYPALLMMKYNQFINYTLFNNSFLSLSNVKTVVGWFIFPVWKLALYISFLLFYIYFLISLFIQKD